jgi:hypothetical protein
LVVLHLISVDTRQIYPLEPLQQPELARGVAQAVDHHEPDVGLQVEGLPGLLGLLLEDGADLEMLPDFEEREDMAVIPSELQRGVCGSGGAMALQIPLMMLSTSRSVMRLTWPRWAMMRVMGSSLFLGSR